jgi:hypothetical protein
MADFGEPEPVPSAPSPASRKRVCPYTLTADDGSPTVEPHALGMVSSPRSVTSQGRDDLDPPGPVGSAALPGVTASTTLDRREGIRGLRAARGDGEGRRRPLRDPVPPTRLRGEGFVQLEEVAANRVTPWEFRIPLPASRR